MFLLTMSDYDNSKESQSLIDKNLGLCESLNVYIVLCPPVSHISLDLR